MKTALETSLAAELEQLKSQAQYRALREYHTGQKLINLSSNDYLGLSTMQTLLQEFYRTLNQANLVELYGLGATSSRLLTGNHPEYQRLEAQLAAAYQREAALVFNSGYHANLGILPALVGSKDAIFSDRLNHASLIDGARLSGAKLFRYPHLDYAQLEHLLEKYRERFEKAVIVTESVFSMDGDRADLKQLKKLKERYQAWLYVDEAHAVGVLGKQGLGLCEEQAVIQHLDLILGTFGKAWASLGAFSISSQLVREYLINKMRPLIFTTALPPIIVHWNRFVLERMPQFREAREHLQQLGQRLRKALQAAGLSTLGESHIVPLMIGDIALTLKVAEALRTHGWLLLPIRPPTVPPGTSRLRISLTAKITWDAIQHLPQVVHETLAR